jgi:hypothetical protein
LQLNRQRSFKIAKVRLDLAVPADLLPVFWTFHFIAGKFEFSGVSDSGRWTGKVHEAIEVHGSADRLYYAAGRRRARRLARSAARQGSVK